MDPTEALTAMELIRSSGYTIDSEWCGHPTTRYVLRHRGDWISQHKDYPPAVVAGLRRRLKAMKRLGYTEEECQTLRDALDKLLATPQDT
jgi:hypothetical protein